MQVATTPKLVALSVERGSVTRQLVERGGTFSVSVLARSDRALVRRFVKPVDAVELDGTRAAVSLQGVPVHEVAGGLPCLRSALAWFACSVRQVIRWDADTPEVPASHVLVVGEVIDAGEAAEGDGGSGDTASVPEVLRMEDTRMNYGG
jgi:flavin reductase (DIM6/NTAB) family NADH-FMN oxidoreductase RutF